MTLNGSVAVITGAAGGLGSYVAHVLAEDGINLALLDRGKEELASLVKDLNLPGSRVISQTLNLLDRNEINASAKLIIAKFEKIDILLHLVGGWTGGKTIVDSSADDLTFMISQHIWTSFNVAQAFVPHLVRNQWGRIIMITSPYGSFPNAKGGPFGIGKAGQEALLMTLSQELKGSGVTANAIQVKTIDVNHERSSNPNPGNAYWTTPEEIAGAILYLLSEEACVVNGTKLQLFGPK